MQKISTLTLNSGDYAIATGVIDTTRGFAYVCTFRQTSPVVNPEILKIDLATFTRVSKISTNNPNGEYTDSFIDIVNNRAYFFGYGTYNVLKVNLDTFTADSYLTTGGGGQAIIPDLANNVAYAGAYGAIYKFSLHPTFAQLLSKAVNNSNHVSACIDTVGGYAYFGNAFTTPGTITRVRLSDFTLQGTLSLLSGENEPTGVAIDTAHGYAYFCTGTSPVRMVKVALSTFTRVGVLELTGFNGMFNGVSIDPSSEFIYFSTVSAPGKIGKVRLSDFTVTDSLTLDTGENLLYSLFSDYGNNLIYALAGTSPGKVIKIDIADTIIRFNKLLYPKTLDVLNVAIYPKQLRNL